MRVRRTLVVGALAVGLSVPIAKVSLGAASAAPVDSGSWSGPLKITKGGTYSGNWASTDADTPAVTVATTEPVVIEGAGVRGPGDLIATAVDGADLTVRNVSGEGLNSGVRGRPNGVFVHASNATRLDVEHTAVEGTDFGVWALGHSGPNDEAHSITIRYNRGRNMTGLHSDGNGGYLPGHQDGDRSWSHYIQLTDIRDLPGVDIGWNEVVDEPGKSLVDDVINCYRCGGTAASPLRIHDNYIQGAYPQDPRKDTYSGGGIITDGNHDTRDTAPAHVLIDHNQVVGTSNYGIAFSNGHDNEIRDNRVISSGLLPDGGTVLSQNVGIYVSDIYGGNVPDSMYGNAVHDNVSGWGRPAGTSQNHGSGYQRGDYYFSTPDTADAYGRNQGLDHDPTLADERAEATAWQQKLSDATVSVGPAASSAPAPAPSGSAPAPGGSNGHGPVTGLAGKCLDVTGAATDNGTPIIIYGCHGGTNQQWTVNGSEIRSDLGKCLDVSGGSTDDTAKVQLYDCNGTPAQQWTPSAGGYLHGPAGKCLDVWGNGDATADLTPVQLFTCHDGANQRWTLPTP